MKKKNTLNFFTPSHGRLEAILINAGISAGFPSPAGDFKQERISLDKELIKNKEATFFARVSGESMINAGLEDGDLITQTQDAVVLEKLISQFLYNKAAEED